MAGGHRAKTAARGRSRRAAGKHRAAQRHRVVAPWLGAGAVTLGIGAALAGGSGVAHADATAAAADTASAHESATPGRLAKATHHGSTTKTPDASSAAHDNHAYPAAHASPTAHDDDSSDAAPRTPQPASTVDAPAKTHRPLARVLTHPAVTETSTSPTPLKSPTTAKTPAAHATTAQQAPAVDASAAPKVALAVATTKATAGVLPVGAPPVAPPLPHNPVVGVLTELAAVVNTIISPNPAVPPSNPVQLLAFEVVRRIELTLGLPVVGTPISITRDPVIGQNPVSASAGTPSADDVVATPYGEIGKWLLQPTGEISSYGGQRYAGKSIIEPVNVIILDPTSASAADAAKKLNADLGAAGFPARAIHSTGFLGVIGDVTYPQQPSGFLQAYSDNDFLLPDDHARVFGPAPAESVAGYVWTVAASRELFGFNGLIPAHTYLSYDQARDELASRLVANGATLVGIVPLQNAYDGPSATAGDHDGYAIVIQLND